MYGIPYFGENELITAVSIKQCRAKITNVNCICTKLNSRKTDPFAVKRYIHVVKL